MTRRITQLNVSVSRIRGSKPAFLSRGYRDRGWIAGFNTRFGGLGVWLYRGEIEW